MSIVDVAIPFFILLGCLIFFHELGHFLVAKWFGVKVEKFSVGFGPAIEMEERAGSHLQGAGLELPRLVLSRAGELSVEKAECDLGLGACEQALELTKEYAKTRKQFDQPIAMFQAVGQRAADAYIDTEGIRLTALQAAWRIAEGLPAAPQVAVAKIWAAEAGQRIVHTAQHLHGGIGVDREYPLHRYFLYAKQLELTLGGATQQLRRLGRMLADEVR